MKQLTYALMSAAFALILLSSCSKFDWKHWKDKHHGKFLVPDCDAQRIYQDVEGGGIEVQMQKTYYSDGRVKKIGFYTFSAVSTDVYWHSFTLDYNIADRTVTITDSARGAAVLKAIFHPSGRLQRLERLQGDTSSFADRTFEYSGGRLTNINSIWKTFNDVETFTYDADGNIVRRVKSADGGVTIAEDAIYTYGVAAAGRRQLYIPQFNYLVVVDPSMALLEYLGWVDDFWPKNILISIEYVQPLPHEEDYSDHVFDAGGKLTSYSIGSFVGGTKYIDWRCSSDKDK
ncbi:MAG: hypothetical protein JNK79_19490 [Chitinophagaceae bacterium]|nr:hypothetical protein [Chitinophagaceae bacterium]